MSLVESVPNVSEGRDLVLLAAMAERVRTVPGVRLLDYSGDAAHHRSVYTMVGEASAVETAVLALVALAVSTIDLRRQRGEHPRMGAVDVIPFIPLAGSTMPECVALARRVGRSIANQFNIPVYLYEEAAVKPARKHLQDIRRGQFEGLTEKLKMPGWAPDFGPASPHPSAGATIVGARGPLIAYNINLATDRIEVARRVAAAVRESSGGLPFVKAIGLSLEDRGIVQVSMNLTDFTQTAIEVVFDRVVAEAAKDRVDVLESELIGLIPAAALAGTTAAHLKLRDFSADRILETRIANA